MKVKSLLLASALTTLLVACEKEETAVSTNEEKEPLTEIQEPNENPEVSDNNSEGIDNLQSGINEGSPFDTNTVAQAGTYVPPLKSFEPSYEYPVKTAKSRNPREVREILVEDGGWWITDYEDNHSVFVEQDSHNEYKTTTKHGLLIYDHNSGSRGEDEWTNHYFRGVYFNQETQKYELKFVIDAKGKGYMSVGLNSLTFDGIPVPQESIHFDTNKTVGPDTAELFTVEVDYEKGMPMDLNTISFNYEFYVYNELPITELDNPMEIYMELSR